MKTFDIWAEGFRATGESGGATYFGTAEAPTFKDACILLFEGRTDRVYFDADRLTYWGCKLFDNETDAQKAFG
jgi:hypothetical protein